MDDRQAVARGVLGLGQLGLDPLAITNKHGSQLRLIAHGLDGARDDRSGSIIASHRVQGYPHDITPTGLISSRIRIRVETTTGCHSREHLPASHSERDQRSRHGPDPPGTKLGLGLHPDHGYRSQAPAWLD